MEAQASGAGTSCSNRHGLALAARARELQRQQRGQQARRAAHDGVRSGAWRRLRLASHATRLGCCAHRRGVALRRRRGAVRRVSKALDGRCDMSRER